MNNLSNKLSNFSIYDVRKVARNAQNSLFASNSPIELMIRTATNTDSWGPSTQQLEAIQNQLIFDDPEEVFDVIFGRIVEYLGSQSRFINKKQSFYNKAVHYVNSGNEWRIISKSLKLIDYLILHCGDDCIKVVQDRRGVLKKILDAYEYEQDSGEMVTSVELEKKEHSKAITNATNEILKLLDDENYRNKEIAKAMRTSKLGSVGNDAPVVVKNRNDKLSGFKTKRMNSSKVQNSNTKSEIRNQFSHVIHTNERLPGSYSIFGNDTTNDHLYDPDDSEFYQADQPYDDTFGEFRSTSKGFKDNSSNESLGVQNKKAEEVHPEFEDDENNEDDDFGDFQATPIAPQVDTFTSKPKDQELLSFIDDEPNTPTNPTISTFDSFNFTSLNSPVSSKPSTSHIRDGSINFNVANENSKPKKDTFADLFQNAKGSN